MSSTIKRYPVPTVAELNKQNLNQFEVVSLFAGGGGSSTGYRIAGGRVLLVNEFIPEAIATYKQNWPRTPVLEGDIRTIDPETILKLTNKKKGELDILDGSPPCSAFSTSGQRTKGWGKTKKYSDKKQANVEDLFFEYMRIAEGLMPRVFIAENVAGLAIGQAKGYLNEILRRANEIGYRVKCRAIDAQYLGVPQRRKRLIFIGVRNDLWRDSFAENLYPKPSNDVVTVGAAINDLKLTQTELEPTRLNPSAKMTRLLYECAPGESLPNNFNWQKIHPDLVSTTILAARDSTPFHWNNRRLTIRELKRLTTLPDDYQLTGSFTQQVERIGRMVPPLMIAKIANAVASTGVIGNK